jgi:hypothetical protein
MRQCTHATEDEFAICCYATCNTGKWANLRQLRDEDVLWVRGCWLHIRVNYYTKISLHRIMYAVITISVQYLQLKARDMTQSRYSDLLRRGGKHFRCMVTDRRQKFLVAASPHTGFYYISVAAYLYTGLYFLVCVCVCVCSWGGWVVDRWEWRQYVPSKRREPLTQRRSVTSQKNDWEAGWVPQLVWTLSRREKSHVAVGNQTTRPWLSSP